MPGAKAKQGFSQIIVFGAGAIGASLGAMLSKQNNVLLVASPENAKAINKRGVRLSEKITGTFKAKATTRLAKIKKNTLVLLTVKNYDVPIALEQLKPLVKKDTVVACLQNGLGSAEQAKKELKCRVVDGFTYFSAVTKEAGKISVSGIGETIFEATKEGKQTAKAIAQSGLPARAAKAFKTEKWKKLCLNCVSNPLSAILGVEPKKVCRPEIIPIMRGLFEECRKVAAKQGIGIEKKLFNEIYQKLCISKHRPSMLQDIELGNPTEIEFLNGKILELGKKTGTRTPYNETITAVIKFMENKKVY